MLQLLGLAVVVVVIGWLVFTLWPVLLFLALCGGILVAIGALMGLLEPPPPEETVEQWLRRKHPETLRHNTEAVAKWRKENGGS